MKKNNESKQEERQRIVSQILSLRAQFSDYFKDDKKKSDEIEKRWEPLMDAMQRREKLK